LMLSSNHLFGSTIHTTCLALVANLFNLFTDES
jgi:hypothetical protein